MAITPMQLPSPKAYDPNQMEMTNLRLFTDPYTVDRASLQADVLRSDREAAGEQYQHAVAGQQDYYNRALQAQADESAQELIPKLLAQPNGVGFLMGIPGLRDVLGRMQQSAPGLYGNYVNQAMQSERAKNLQASGAGVYSALQGGHQVSPEGFESASGVGSTAVTPLAVQIEGMQQAGANARHASSEEGSTGGSMSVPLPPIQLPDGRWVSPTYSVNKKVTSQDQWMNDVIRKGGYVPRPTGLQPNQQPNQQGAPTGQQGKPGLPPQEQRQGSPGTPAGRPNRNAEWDAVKTKLPPEVSANVERARKMNNGNIIFDEKRRVIIGNDAQGHRREYPLG